MWGQVTPSETTLSTSSSEGSESFNLLDKRIQRWVWQQNWPQLHDAQERAIPVILEGWCDVLIAAQTASGKTEAAFLPILSQLLASKDGNGVALYISPLKALINDQWERLDLLCEALNINVTPWHGDISSAKKQKFVKRPSGCVLITPESLEALFYNRGSAIKAMFEGLQYIVVDELHAFIGSERGKQLQSLLTRLEVVLGRRVPRIALSATLGDLSLAADFLRPGEGKSAATIDSQAGKMSAQIRVKGFLDLPPVLSDAEIREREEAGSEPGLDETTPIGKLAIARHLYEHLHGTNNLVFPNSRQAVEQYTTLLRGIAEENHMPAEFWPHHGNLSKELREDTERALKQTERPATAVATSTLELGIDIGPVVSVAQIGPAPSVSSLRQRLGRSGRRAGTSAILRGYALEPELGGQSPIADALREPLVQLTAQILLLLERWFEPPRAGGMHLSTLIQQLLSVIGQYGGVSAAQAYGLLCKKGPFQSVSQADFAFLLKALGAQKVIIQDASGVLLHGEVGEAIANHYSFYAAFSSPEEFRLVSRGRTLGTLPITSPLSVGDYLIFGGRRWRVEMVDEKQKLVDVDPARGGRAPAFGGTAGLVHTHVRQKMKAILASAEPVKFLDARAQELLDGARNEFHAARLPANQRIISFQGILLFVWQGDEIQNTLALLLRHRGVAAKNEGLCVAIENCGPSQLDSEVDFLLAHDELNADELLVKAGNLMVEKWDVLVPSPLRERNYASLFLDIPGTYAFLRQGFER
jgi:ATP-dependent Lhr-like helicase